MNIHTEKIELVKLLLSTNNLKIIESVKQIFEQEKVNDFWDELSLDQQKEIKEATLEIEQGQTTDYEAFIVANNDIVQLSEEQIIMLQLSDKDIIDGKLISQEQLDKSDLEWLKGQ